MANIDRVRVEITGVGGSPGVATFYATDGPALLPHVRQFYDSIKAGQVGAIRFNFPGDGDTVNEVNGDLIGAWTATPGAQVSGADTGPYPAGAGCAVTWLTDAISDTRRLKGRTYLVPLGGGSYQEDGTINPTNLGTIVSAAAAFVTAAADNLLIWHRPRLARAVDGSRPAVEARDGSSAFVTGSSVRDKVAILRSRRD